MNQKQIDIHFPTFGAFTNAPQSPTQWYRIIRNVLRENARTDNCHRFRISQSPITCNWENYRAELFRRFYNGEFD